MAEPGKILLVDDNPQNLGVLTGILKSENHTILVATDGKRAIEVARNAKPDLILLDIMMPGLDGIEVCNRIKTEVPEIAEIPIIFITALSDTDSITTAFASGGVDYIVKPIRAEEVIARVRSHLQLFKMKRALESQVELKNQEIMDTKAIALKAVANLAETRDPETGAHLQRVQLYIRQLARELQKESPYAVNIDDNYIQDLYDSSPLHDIGKVGIPDKILLKPGRLTDKEFDIMKTHSQIGYFSLKRAKIPGRDNSFLDVGADIAYAHHEKWDGSGYPRGLSSTEIPLAGRLMAFVDVYDALTSQRVYKKAFTHEKSTHIMFQEMTGHFDPEIIRVFLKIEDWFKDVSEKYRDDEDWEISSLI